MKQVGAVRGGEGVVVSKMLEAKCTCQCWDSGANGKQAALLKGHRREARQPMRTARRSVRACASRTAHRLALRQQRAASSVEHAQHAHYSRSADGADGLAAILARGRCVLQGCSSALAAHRAVPAWDLCMWQKNRWEGCRGLIGKRAQVHGGRGGPGHRLLRSSRSTSLAAPCQSACSAFYATLHSRHFSEQPLWLTAATWRGASMQMQHRLLVPS